ncbi:MAG TPA: OB-fold domain-containing protein [Streptosporangiaceae bacterium]|nr:OB-fold domain-containing protein [Streptosporangiaceae bacterium]
MTTPPVAPLSAPLDISFDYTRSLGPVLSRFMAGLAQRRILGSRSADGRVYAPPAEYDPVTFASPAELVPVGPGGMVLTWSWQLEPREGQPLGHPFAWALIRLDGADTGMLHAVDAGNPANMHTGMRVQARWADNPAGHITDIVCFEPESADPSDRAASAAGDPVPIEGADARPGMIVTPVRLHYLHSASAEESRYLRGLAEGKVIGQRCPACGKVYVPPRGACPVDGVPTSIDVELPDVGTVTTFCVVNVPFQGQRVPSPYVAASVLLDGADIAFQHLILGCEPDEVRMGMRVRAVWKPPEQWGTTSENIDHFEPTGEPDAPYDSYAHHL